MKTKRINLLFICVAFTFLTCKKDSPVSTSSESGNLKERNFKRIPNKIFNLTQEQILETIKKFKHIDKNSNTARLIRADSISVDSSIFVVEAALNYDYDFSLDSNYRTQIDTFQVTKTAFNVGGKLMIRSGDIQDVYSALGSAISNIINDTTKIRLVDIEAFINNDDVLFKARAVKIHNTTRLPCGLAPGNYIALKSAFTSYGCPGTLPDALAAANNAYNCLGYVCRANVDYFYTNVWYFATGYVWTSPLQSPAAHCASPMIFNASTISSYMSGSMAGALFQLTSAFSSSYSILQINFYGHNVAYGANYEYFWTNGYYIGEHQCLTISRH